jgi:hypothetical protein
MLQPRYHRLTHLRLDIRPVWMRNARAERVKCSDRQRWMPLDGEADRGMPKPVARLVEELRNGEIA